VIAAFRATVERFRDKAAVLDGDAAAVLDRLVADDWWPLVRAALDLLPAEKWPRLLATCVEAERVARTHARTRRRSPQTTGKGRGEGGEGSPDRKEVFGARERRPGC
jgi:hypothetical protein